MKMYLLSFIVGFAFSSLLMYIINPGLMTLGLIFYIGFLFGLSIAMLHFFYVKIEDKFFTDN